MRACSPTKLSEEIATGLESGLIHARIKAGGACNAIAFAPTGYRFCGIVLPNQPPQSQQASQSESRPRVVNLIERCYFDVVGYRSSRLLRNRA
jgi:hypothetical protein